MEKNSDSTMDVLIDVLTNKHGEKMLHISTTDGENSSQLIVGLDRVRFSEKFLDWIDNELEYEGKDNG